MLASTVTTYKKPKISEIQKLNREYSLFLKSHFPNILVLGIELRSWIIRLYASLQIENCNQNPFSLPQKHDLRCPWHPQVNFHYNRLRCWCWQNNHLAKKNKQKQTKKLRPFLVAIFSIITSNSFWRLRTLTSSLSLAFLVCAREVIHCADKTDAGLAVMTSLSCECQLSA